MWRGWTTRSDERWMRLAIARGARARSSTATCRSARSSSATARSLGAGHNERELRQDPTAHAEILALREAARALGSLAACSTRRST